MTDPGVGRGLDVTRPDELTDEEHDAYLRVNLETFGHPHRGLEFWLEERPDVLKRYRAYTDTIPAPGGIGGLQGFGFLSIYIHRGFDTGIRYIVRGMTRRLTKSQVHEAIAVAFLDSIGGPIGMHRTALALDGLEWPDPVDPQGYPDGWAADPGALRSGVDFTTPASRADTDAITQWYAATLGEVPGWVRFLARERPDLLKAHRARVEHTLRELPNQIMPLMLIMAAVERGLADGIREGILLGKGLGMTRAQVTEAILQAALKGGPQRLGLVETAAGDLLEGWG